MSDVKLGMAEWILRQLEEREAWAREASREGSHYLHDGAHWQWVAGDYWEPVDPDVTDPDFEANGLTSVEEFPTGGTNIMGHNGIKQTMSMHFLYTEGVSTGAAGHIIRNDPAFVLRACAVQRLLVQRCVRELNQRGGGAEDGLVDCLAWDILTMLAQQFERRPGA